MSGPDPSEVLRDLATRVAENPEATPHELLTWHRAAGSTTPHVAGASPRASEASLALAEEEWRRRWGRTDVPTAELSRLLGHMAEVPAAFELAGWLDARAGWLACVHDPRGVDAATLQRIAKAVARDPDAIRWLEQEMRRVETRTWATLRHRAPALHRALLAMRPDASPTTQGADPEGAAWSAGPAAADDDGEQGGGSGWGRVLLLVVLAVGAGKVLLRSSRSERASQELKRSQDELKEITEDVNRVKRVLDDMKHSQDLDVQRDELRELLRRAEQRRSRRRGEEPIEPPATEPPSPDGSDDSPPEAAPR